MMLLSFRTVSALMRAVLIPACLLSLNACYTYHVYQTGGPAGREQANQPGTEWRHGTLNAFAWGAVRQDLPIDNCQPGNGQRFGIEEIKIETNFGYVLASAVTLGIWVPLDVSWRCGKPCAPSGVLE